MDEFLSFLLRQDAPQVHNTVQVEEGCPRDLFYMWVTCPGPNSGSSQWSCPATMVVILKKSVID